MREAEIAHEKYQIEMAKIAKRVGNLEITQREKRLRALFFDYSSTFPLGLVGTNQTKISGVVGSRRRT